MSVLVDRDVFNAVESGAIVIRPFERRHLGTNSYDVHLAPVLRVYQRYVGGIRPLDARADNPTRDVEVPDVGYVLSPGELYLASTVEYTESHVHLPILNGKSSLGRLGLSVHVTAGTGDVGFRGHWTLELTIVRPLRIYAGMAVGQLLWFEASGVPEVPYDEKPGAKYRDAGPLPQASRMHEER